MSFGQGIKTLIIGKVAFVFLLVLVLIKVIHGTPMEVFLLGVPVLGAVISFVLTYWFLTLFLGLFLFLVVRMPDAVPNHLITAGLITFAFWLIPFLFS